jgi:hypothetical protein
MSYGLCCVTEPRSRTALQLDIFIEILPLERTSENSVNAKFAEFYFYEVG